MLRVCCISNGGYECYLYYCYCECLVGIFVGCVILVVVVVILFDVFLVCWFYVIVFWMFEVYVLYIVFRCYSYVWKKEIKLCIYNIVLLIGGCKL